MKKISIKTRLKYHIHVDRIDDKIMIIIMTIHDYRKIRMSSDSQSQLSTETSKCCVTEPWLE